MARPVAQIALDSLALDATGADDPVSHHLLCLRMIWPRPGIAERVSLREITLENGRTDLATAPWHARILFKESVEGPFALEASISEALPATRVGVIMQHLLEAMADASVAGIGKAAGTGFTGTLLRAPLRALAARAGERAEADPAAVAEGTVDIAADVAPGPFAIPLAAPCDVHGASVRQRPGPPPCRAVDLAGGAPNGSLTLTLDL